MLLRLVFAAALIGTVAAPISPQAGQPELAFAVRLVASGFDRPVDIAVPAGGSNRMSIVVSIPTLPFSRVQRRNTSSEPSAISRQVTIHRRMLTADG